MLSPVLIRCVVVLSEVRSSGTLLGFRFQTHDGLLEPLPMQNQLYLFSEPVCHLVFSNNLQFPDLRGGLGYVMPLWDLVFTAIFHITLSLPLTPLEDLTLFIFYLHVSQMSIIRDNCG